MKKTFLFFCKLAISGILALAILCGFALVYYNPPVAVPNEDKFTNSKFTSGSYWTDMSEGVGYGKTNHLGFNEVDTVDPAKPLVAVIGSSHTEALQVPQTDTYTAQLQQLQGNQVNCVNFGISGHFLNISVSNFRYFAESYADAQVTCAIIETANLSYTPAELEKMLNEEYHSDLQPRGGLYALAQKLPYLRLLYKQYQDTRQKGGSAAPSEPAPFDYEGYEAGLQKVMEKLSAIAAEQGFPLVILYHDAIGVEGNRAYRQDDAQQVEIFKNCCEANGIRFVDVTDRFISHYESTYELPYGFSNTTPGTGHLNTLGHRLIAEELAPVLEGN